MIISHLALLVDIGISNGEKLQLKGELERVQGVVRFKGLEVGLIGASNADVVNIAADGAHSVEVFAL